MSIAEASLGQVTLDNHFYTGFYIYVAPTESSA